MRFCFIIKLNMLKENHLKVQFFFPYWEFNHVNRRTLHPHAVIKSSWLGELEPLYLVIELL